MAQDLMDPMANIIAPSQTPNPVITDDGVIYEVISEGRQIESVRQQPLDGHQTLEAINNIYAIQQHIMENQNKIIKKLSEISVQIEEIKNNRQPLNVTPLSQTKGTVEAESFMIRAINDISNLENLEHELSNTHLRNSDNNTQLYVASHEEMVLTVLTGCLIYYLRRIFYANVLGLGVAVIQLM